MCPTIGRQPLVLAYRMPFLAVKTFNMYMNITQRSPANIKIHQFYKKGTKQHPE